MERGRGAAGRWPASDWRGESRAAPTPRQRQRRRGIRARGPEPWQAIAPHYTRQHRSNPAAPAPGYRLAADFRLHAQRAPWRALPAGTPPGTRPNMGPRPVRPQPRSQEGARASFADHNMRKSLREPLQRVNSRAKSPIWRRVHQTCIWRLGSGLKAKSAATGGSPANHRFQSQRGWSLPHHPGARRVPRLEVERVRRPVHAVVRSLELDLVAGAGPPWSATRMARSRAT